MNETMYNYKSGKIENNLPKKYLLGIDGEKYKKKCEKTDKKGFVQQGIAKSGAESPILNFCTSIPQNHFLFAIKNVN